ncbi:hypothetical protein [Sandaracinus amylolyticus]|uniref:hypothetical protein n=1 Tax=Sandaracinus amylolyticus TaxID=927083 RepID=UPI001F42FA2B|nr:hypothetical protein [Sandaracinus amylolyticus]
MSALGCDQELQLGQRCELASDCPAPLGCVLGRCREECASAVDCASGEECLRDASGVLACSVAEDHCPCEDGLVCDGDRCRQPCSLSCAPGMQCAGEVCVRGSATSDAGTCASPCDPVARCGCDEGSRCGVIAGEIECYASTGTVSLEGACTSSAECAEGLGCHGGRCLEYCDASSDCELEDAYCGRESHAGVSALPEGVRLCTEECDPRTDEGCAEGSCSLAFGGDPEISTWCRPVGTTVIGEACERDQQCVAGALCTHVAALGGRACVAFCTVGETCAGGTTCVESARVRDLIIGTCPLPGS